MELIRFRWQRRKLDELTAFVSEKQPTTVLLEAGEIAEACREIGRVEEQEPAKLWMLNECLQSVGLHLVRQANGDDGVIESVERRELLIDGTAHRRRDDVVRLAAD